MRAKRPLAQVAHALPRRVRVRAPRLAGHREACARVATQLALDPANERVSVHPMTGSILVEREDGTLDADALARRVAALVGAERDELGRSLALERPATDGPTRLARAVAHAAVEINEDVSEALGHRADLGTLLPIAFAAGGFVEVAVTRSVPGPTWFNLLWWSLRSFMTFNVEAVDIEGHHAHPPEWRDLGDIGEEDDVDEEGDDGEDDA